MTYEEFLKLTKEEQLKILNEYAKYNFSEGELNENVFEYGNGSGGCICDFEAFIKYYGLIKKEGII